MQQKHIHAVFLTNKVEICRRGIRVYDKFFAGALLKKRVDVLMITVIIKFITCQELKQNRK